MPSSEDGTPDCRAVLDFEAFKDYLTKNKTRPRYDSAKEEKTTHPYWSIDRAPIDDLLNKMSTLVQDCMHDVPERDEELRHILKKAPTLPKIERSPPIKIALLGAQGAGKSLLINALFDCDGLSLTGADGAACTSSIVKYGYYPKSQGNDGERMFCAEITFLGEQKMKSMIRDHAKAYYDYHNDDSDDSDDETHGKASGQDETDRRRKATAEDVFQTLFGSTEQFLENWNLEQYRNGEFMTLCWLKCQESLEYIEVKMPQTKTFMATNQDALLSQIKPFLTKVKGVQCLWPLVDCVCIRFAHDLLRQGIEIIDLPGSGDTNTSRTRHAENIKDTVDFQIVLADTIRITTDDSMMNTVRSGILTHGASRVKIVATKIDQIHSNQLGQCSGKIYDQIQHLKKNAEQEARLAEALEDDPTKSDLCNKHKTYLERCLKQNKITERANDITSELTTKLQGRTTGNAPQVFHISASEYMSWIIQDANMIPFRFQPDLPPEMTGIPALRQLLYSLTAPRNLNDVTFHAYTEVPAYLEKMVRVVTQIDRDAGFRTLADNFDFHIRSNIVSQFLSQVKWAFQNVSRDNNVAIQPDMSAYKTQINKDLNRWFLPKGATFSKLIRCRGKIRKGASKARGLEDGCDWNKELAVVLEPAFQKWIKAHSDRTTVLGPYLHRSMVAIFNETLSSMDKSPANLLIVNKAKSKWNPYQLRMRVKIGTMIEDIQKMEQRMLRWATMEDDRDDNLIASVMDDIYDKVSSSAPPQKDGSSSSAKKKTQYKTPKIQFQKDTMRELMTKPDRHVAEVLIKTFRSKFDEEMGTLLEKHFKHIDDLLKEYSDKLRELAPISYRITQTGEAIRADLEKLIPTLQDKSNQLKALLPAPSTQDSEHTGYNLELSTVHLDSGVDALYNAIVQRKRNPATNPSNRIKREPEARYKKIKLEPM